MKNDNQKNQNLSFDFLRDEKSLYALKEEWQDLCKRSPKHRFSQTFAWCCISWETIDRPLDHRLYCLIARKDGRLVLVWPFVIARTYFVSFAAPLGGANTEYNEPLVELGRDTENLLDEAFKILRQICPCDYFLFPAVRGDSNLQVLLHKKSIPKSAYDINLYVSWEGIESWQNYLNYLPKKIRSDLARRRRRLQEQGDLTFEIFEGINSEQVIDWHIRTKIEHLSRTNRRGDFLHSKAYRDHLIEAARKGNIHGGVVVFILKLNGRKIATNVTRIDDSRIEALNSTYDVEFSKYAPSRLLRFETLKWAYHRRLEFDMRLGEYDHKRIWANREIPVFTYEIENSFLSVPFLRLVKFYRFATLPIRALRDANYRSLLFSVFATKNSDGKKLSGMRV